MVPARDYVDVAMTVTNHTEFFWHDVFAFNCLNPVRAPDFNDWTLERTYMSSQGKPLCLARTQRVRGHRPTVGFYLPDRVEAGKESVFVRGFGATSPDRTDGSWIVTLSQPQGAYMAVSVVETTFLFNNLDRCCIHAAAGFGDIGPGQAGATVSRFYLARGSLEDFLKRWEADRPGLTSRQKAISLAPVHSQRIAARESANPRRATSQRSEARVSADETRRYSFGAKFEPPGGSGLSLVSRSSRNVAKSSGSLSSATIGRAPRTSPKPAGRTTISRPLPPSWKSSWPSCVRRSISTPVRRPC